MMGAAFCEGLAAHREYEALRSRGMAHERALRQALGLGCSVGRVLRNANLGITP
jgi:hypothetical protein